MKKILVLDRLEPLIDNEGGVLSRKNIKIFTALSGKEILKIHRSEKVNLIIAELKMQGMDGDIVCSVIRDEDVLKQVSFIIICGDNKSEIARCRACGVNTFITKPVAPAELSASLRKYLYVLERKDLRADLKGDVKCSSGGGLFFASADNISSSGILISTDKVVEKGSEISCSLFIEEEEITVHGRVKRVIKKTPDRYLYGIQFERISILSQARVERFIQKG